MSTNTESLSRPESGTSLPQTTETIPRIRHETTWRCLVKDFVPSWFSVTMGTGIVGVLFCYIPFRAQWIYYLSILFFAVDALLFILAIIVSIIRYALYPEMLGSTIRDPASAIFLATIPLSFAILIELWLSICVPVWGPWALTFAWVCWMVDTIVAVATTISLPYLTMSATTAIGLERVNASQLLPIAATVVASGVGAIIAGLLPNPQHGLGTLLTSYVTWGMSVPLAFTILVMYYQRLTLMKLPPKQVIVSCCVPLGPLGFGGFGIFRLGRSAVTIFKATDTLPEIAGLAGPILYAFGFLAALLMWAFGCVWLSFAAASIIRSYPFPFNMGWWGFTFPLAVYALSTIQIGSMLVSKTFEVFGTIISAAVVLLWIFVAGATVKDACTGNLLFGPCLGKLPSKREEKHQVSSEEDFAQDLEAGGTQERI